MSKIEGDINQQLRQATPREELERQIMSSLVPKNEREHWACREIESLREQLAAVEHDRDNLLNQNVMLREALDRFAPIDLRYKTLPETFAFDVLKARKALAATDDLDGYILCEKEPIAWESPDLYPQIVDHQRRSTDAPLYRPRRPE